MPLLSCTAPLTATFGSSQTYRRTAQMHDVSSCACKWSDRKTVLWPCSKCWCMQTVVLDYIQSEIQLKSSRDKSQLELAGMIHHAAVCVLRAQFDFGVAAWSTSSRGFVHDCKHDCTQHCLLCSVRYSLQPLACCLISCICPPINPLIPSPPPPPLLLCAVAHPCFCMTVSSCPTAVHELQLS